MSTPHECYLRCVYTRGDVEIITGIEIYESELELSILHASFRAWLKSICAAVLDQEQSPKTDGEIAKQVFERIEARWPQRRYFLEVQHDDPNEGWVQVITPFGWPPKKETA